MGAVSDGGTWEIGRIRVDGLPIKLSETPASIERGAPTLGEHNEEVFVGTLGMSQSDYRALTDEGVI